VPPFIPLASSINWLGNMPRLAYVLFECFGIAGQGNIHLYDSDNNLVVSDTGVTIPSGSSYFWNVPLASGRPFDQISFGSTGSDDMEDMFTEFTSYKFKISQPETGELGITTDTTGSVLPWNVSLSFDEMLNPALWNGGIYTLRLQRVIVSAQEGTPDYLANVSILHPDETNPSYRRYEIPKLRGTTNGASTCGCSGDADEPKKVIIMAKLRYLPVKRMTDFLLIENIGALKNMLIALNYEEKGEFTIAQQYEAKAEKILSDELQNFIGDSATSNQPMQVQQDAWAASTIPNLL
jgi:hypothetical protein